jgi:hypothetical protein
MNMRQIYTARQFNLSGLDGISDQTLKNSRSVKTGLCIDAGLFYRPRQQHDL